MRHILLYKIGVKVMGTLEKVLGREEECVGGIKSSYNVNLEIIIFKNELFFLSL